MTWKTRIQELQEEALMAKRCGLMAHLQREQVKLYSGEKPIQP